MGEIREMAAAREARRHRRIAAAAAVSPSHPALRWVAGDAYWLGHRRTDGGTACGAGGELVLAPPGVPPCTDCYPGAAAGKTVSG